MLVAPWPIHERLVSFNTTNLPTVVSAHFRTTRFLFFGVRQMQPCHVEIRHTQEGKAGGEDAGWCIV